MVESLLAVGYRLEEIGRYSVRQATALLELGSNNKRREIAALAGMHRIAAHAESKDFKDYLKDLTPKE